MNGHFMVLDGINGCGKTTVARHLCAMFNHEGHRKCVQYCDPGDSMVGWRIRNIVKDPGVPMQPVTQFLLYTAARMELAHRVADDLRRGIDVVMDRWWPSTYAYQGAQGVSDDNIIKITQMLTPPGAHMVRGLSFYLDVTPETAHHRARHTGAREAVESGGDRFEEKGLEFSRNLRARYMELVDAGMVTLIDAEHDAPEVIAEKIHELCFAEFQREGAVD